MKKQFYIGEPLLLEWINGYHWKLAREFGYHALDGKEWMVPVAFDTDLASIPRIFWRWTPPAGPWGKAAIIHDFLCKHPSIERKYADDIFLEAMLYSGVHRWLAYSLYAGVRVGAFFTGKWMRVRARCRKLHA
jgi:hypothetical protein